MINFNKKYNHSSFEKIKKENPNIDPYYLRYRCDPKIWNNVLKMFSLTKEYLDDDFGKKYIENEHINGLWINRLRELMVGYALVKESKFGKRFRMIKKVNDAGPDFCIEVENRMVHIECICVGDEDVEKNRNNKTPKLKGRRSINLSGEIDFIDRPFYLRMSSGLREKTKKYYSHYKNNINKDGLFIVALSLSNELISDPTRVLNRILYGVGNDVYRTNGKRLEFQGFEYKQDFKKITYVGELEFIKALFLDDYYSPVSLVMFHKIVVFGDNEFNEFGLNNFQFYHNTNQETKKFNGLYGIGKHYGY